MLTLRWPDRDPRGRVITVAYLPLSPDMPAPVAGTDARAARWVPVQRALGCAAELRQVYEAVWGFPLDPSNFRRKVTRAERFLEPTGERQFPETGRPAVLYRRGTARLLHPPLMRSGNIAHAQVTAAALR